MPTWEDIEQARGASRASRTARPCCTRGSSTRPCGATVFFKAENLQRGGAFKFRGAYNKIKAETRAPAGRGGRRLLLRESRPGGRARVDAARHPRDGRHAERRAAGEDRRDARLRRRGRALRPRDAEPRRSRRARSAASGAPCWSRPSTTSSIMAGQATGAVELLEDVPDLDAVVVPVSGGGLHRRLGDGGAHAAARDPRSTAPSPRPPPTRSSRSPPATGRGPGRTRRSPTACASPRPAS